MRELQFFSFSIFQFLNSSILQSFNSSILKLFNSSTLISIRRHKQRSVPRLNMASMPDLIFTVLFFFMTITHMRNETPRLSIETPEGKELTQPSSKHSIVNLYIGANKHGQTLVQVGNRVVKPEQLGKILPPADEEVIVNIRADKGTPMGIISDVKQELRRNGLLNIRYNATEKK